MKLLFSIILLILLIIFFIYVAMLNPVQVAINLPLIGTINDVPLIVVILGSILTGVTAAFVIVTFREFVRSLRHMS
ncbi:MAG: hypothetical protein ACE5GM_03600, partial [bacterium]